MSYLRKRSSNRVARGGRERQARRFGFDTLERRDCPAVLFELLQGDDGTVLRVIGDDGPNLIEILQPRDRVVEVTGDGENRVFDGVDEVLVLAGPGNDTITFLAGAASSFTLGIDAGEGDDQILVGDGEPQTELRQQKQLRAAQVQIEMGTGIDSLRVLLNNHGNVSVDVLSADGGDTIEAPIVLSLCQPPRGGPSFVCGLRASMQLGGGGNSVAVQSEGFDQVSLDASFSAGDNHVELLLPAVQQIREAALCAPDPCRRQASVALDLVGNGNVIDVNLDGYDDVDLDLDLIGDHNVAEIGLLVPAVQQVRQAHAQATVHADGVGNYVKANVEAEPYRKLIATDFVWGVELPRDDSRSATTFDLFTELRSDEGQVSANVAFTGGRGDDQLSFQSLNVDTLNFAADTGDGNDVVEVNANWTNTRGKYLTLRPRPVDHLVSINTSILTGAGNDTVCVRMGPIFGFKQSRLVHRVDLGAGNDRVTNYFDGIDDVTSFIDCGAGDDVVESHLVRSRGLGNSVLSQLNAAVLLGLGNDRLELDVRQYHAINFRIHSGPAGDGSDVISVALQHLPSRGLVREINHTFDDALDGLSLRAEGYREVFLLPSTNDSRDLGIAASLGPRG